MTIISDQPSESYIDFRDGNGKVRARRHPNGGGWVACKASVDDSIYVSENARVGPGVHISGKSRIEGYARVRGIVSIQSSTICGRASLIGPECPYVLHVSPGCHLSGSASVAGCVWLGKNVMLSGRSRVVASGDRSLNILEAVSLRGGVWSASPFFANLGQHTIRIEKPGYLTIGCETRSFDRWLADGPRRGAEYGYSPQEVKSYMRMIRWIIKEVREGRLSDGTPRKEK